MSSNRSIEVRRASLSDYENVMDINRNVYQGFDYLPFQYEGLLADPDFKYYVCVVDGEVAAFEGVCLLDDNNTCMMRSLRVKEKFSGQGLLSLMRAAIHKDLKDLPGQKRLRSGCSEQARYVHSKTFRSENKTLLVERNIHYVIQDVMKMKPVTCHNDSKSKSISWDEFGHLIDIEAVRNYLYPANLITANYWFFDVIKSNIRHLKKISPRVFVTQGLFKFLPNNSKSKPLNANGAEDGSSDPNKIDNTSHGNVMVGGDEITSCDQGVLGIVTSYLSPDYDYTIVNISGKPTKDNEILEIRLIAQQTLAFMQEMYKTEAPANHQSKTVFGFVCSLDLSKDLFDQAVEPFGIKPTVWHPEFHEQYYFEQDFDKLLQIY